MKRALNYHCRRCSTCIVAKIPSELCDLGFAMFAETIRWHPTFTISNIPAFGDAEFQHELESEETYVN